MYPQMVVTFHEIFHEHLPVEGAFPLAGDDQFQLFQAEGLEISGHFGQSLRRGGGALRHPDLHKHETLPHSSLRNGLRKKLSRQKPSACCISGARFEAAIQFRLECPRVIGAKEQPRLAAIRLPVARLGRRVAVITKTFRHNVHGAMRADAGKDADSFILAVDENQRLAEQIEIEKIARLRDLRDMGQALPAPAQQVLRTSQAKNSSLV